MCFQSSDYGRSASAACRWAEEASCSRERLLWCKYFDINSVISLFRYLLISHTSRRKRDSNTRSSWRSTSSLPPPQSTTTFSPTYESKFQRYLRLKAYLLGGMTNTSVCMIVGRRGSQACRCAESRNRSRKRGAHRRHFRTNKSRETR